MKQNCTADSRYYVYVYLDPRKPGNYVYDDLIFKYEPFYIGKGGTKKQYLRHLNDKNNNTKNIIKFNKIKKIRNLGLVPIVYKILQNLTEDEAYKNENILINKIGRISIKNGPLSNLNEGGHGGQGNPSTELRQKFGAATKGKTYEEIYGSEKAAILKNERIKSNKQRNIKKIIDRNITGKTIEIYNKELNWSKKSWKLISPANDIILTKNLHKTCKSLGIGEQSISKLARGIISYYKGWLCEIIN